MSLHNCFAPSFFRVLPQGNAKFRSVVLNLHHFHHHDQISYKLPSTDFFSTNLLYLLILSHFLPPSSGSRGSCLHRACRAKAAAHLSEAPLRALTKKNTFPSVPGVVLEMLLKPPRAQAPTWLQQGLRKQGQIIFLQYKVIGSICFLSGIRQGS